MKLTKKINLTLSADDLKQINSSDKEVLQFLAFLKHKEFNIGDTLIQKRKENLWVVNGGPDYRWNISLVHQRGSVRKYIVVHVDELGIPYLKKLSVNGHLLGTIKSLADIDFRTEIYEEDPDIVDAILLGKEEFDPIELERKKKV